MAINNFADKLNLTNQTDLLVN